ncbi:MAG: GntR family transcriptional regulator [Chloroflexota bacterium]
MESPFQLARVEGPLSLKDKAYAAIKDAILSLQLKPGEPLVETELAEQLGISKTPVRDALQQLERGGFVTRVLFKGTYVTEVTLKDVKEVFQLRAVLEGLAARLAAPLLTPEEWDEGERLIGTAEAALAQGNRELCSQLGKQFHNLVIQKTDNQRLIPILHNLDDHLQRFRLVSDQISGRLEKSVQEHRRVLEALRQRDPALAEQAMRDHLHSVLQDLSEEKEQ